MNTVDYLKNIGLEFDKEYKFKTKVNKNALSKQALREAYKVLVDYCESIGWKTGIRLDLPNPVNLRLHNPNDGWDLWRDENNRTWVKRYRQYVRDISGIVLPSDLMGRVGEVCTRIRGVSSGDWIFDFHAGADWMPGQFAEKEDSCWWNSYNEGRVTASQKGLCAIRFYNNRRGDGNRGIGRAWLWAYDNVLLMFNLYHANYESRESASKMLTQFLSSTSGDWDFSIAELDFENLFINNDATMVIFNKDIVTKPKDYYSVGLRIKGVEQMHCSQCYRPLDSENKIPVEHGLFMCQECFSLRGVALSAQDLVVGFRELANNIREAMPRLDISQWDGIFSGDNTYTNED